MSSSASFPETSRSLRSARAHSVRAQMMAEMTPRVSSAADR
jgi:hypothetical protein